MIKMGRTQMQDAVPIRLGQEFKAYSVAVMRDIRRMDKAMEEMCTLNMGGTAIGTGINADEAYLRRIVPNLAEVSNMEFVQAFDLIDATQNLDPFVAVSAYAVRTFVDNCVSGITANEERCRSLVENSIGVITALSPHVGYEKAADISKKALQTGTSVRSIILQEGLLDEEELDHILDPVRMTEPGISGKELLMKNNIDEK